MLKGKTVVLGVTGSIAAYKIANLASMLVKKHANVHVIMTENACNFINPITFETLTGNKCLVDTFDRNFQFNVEHIITARAGGGYEAVTGTSFAAPFVTGSAALMMQWGIVNGNDPYLYGEKLKAYLIRGARSLPGETVYPNERVGYGALCLERSFPL